MKIHIVKKGDTLWEIANNYNVDFEQLKMLNPQLSSPDMIMPGMKIKIPSDAKPVKKESMKEEKEIVKTPYKDMSPKPLPVIKEDEKEKPKMNEKPPMHQMQMPKMEQKQPMSQMPQMQMPKMEQKQPMPQMPQMQMPMMEQKQPMPQMPKMQMPMMEQKQPMPQMHQTQMPMMEQDMNQFTTINFSQMPPAPNQKNEMKHHETMQPMPQPQYMQMVPMCCYPMHPYNHPMHHGEQPMHMAPQKSMPMQMPSYKPQGCGCGCEGEKPPFQHDKQKMNMYEEMPEMAMPKKPKYKYDEDCDDMNNHHYYGNQKFPQMDMNKGHGNQYPTPPGFQPFPTAPFRDDEGENNTE